MSHEVQFQDESTQSLGSYRSRKLIGDPVVPPFVKKLVDWGVVKNYDSAGKVVVGVAVFFFLCALGVYYFASPHLPTTKERAHIQANAD